MSWDKEAHYKKRTKSIQKADISTISTYGPNIRATTQIKQTLTELRIEKDSNTIIVGDCSTSLSIINRLSKQKINKEIGYKQHYKRNVPHKHI